LGGEWIFREAVGIFDQRADRGSGSGKMTDAKKLKEEGEKLSGRGKRMF